MFLLNFETFNFNIHNCLVDFGEPSNVMPYVVSKKISVEPRNKNT